MPFRHRTQTCSTVFALILPVAVSAAESCCDWPDLRDAHAESDDSRFRVGVTYGYSQMDSLQTGTRSISQRQARSDYDQRPTEMTTHRITTRAALALSPRYEVGLTLPWVRNTMTMQSFMSDHTMCGDKGIFIRETQGNGYRHKMDPVEGWGDLVLDASIRLLDEGEAATGLHRVYLRPGLKTPTGDYKATSSGTHTIRTPWGPHTMKHGGGYADPCMQPGTGSWDPLAQLDYVYRRDRFALALSGDYQLTTRNSLGYEYGDAASLGVYPSYQLLRWLTLTAGIRYRNIASSDDSDGRYTDRKDLTKDPANTGGDYADAILALDLALVRDVVLSAGVSLPVWSDVNGIQMEPSELYTCGLAARF